MCFALNLFRINGHPLSVELEYGNVYCSECEDFVYHAELTAVGDACTDRAHRHLTGSEPWRPWRPSQQEVLHHNSTIKGYFIIYITFIIAFDGAGKCDSEILNLSKQACITFPSPVLVAKDEKLKFRFLYKNGLIDFVHTKEL